MTPVLEQVLEQYPRRVKIAFKHFPLRNHKYALQAAQASIAARAQGKFWEFHDRLFQNYNRLNEAKITEIRDQLGLDPKRFARDMLAAETQNRIRDDLREGQQAGVRGTPTIFINGRRLADRSLRGFKQAIDEALAEKADKR